LTWFTPALGWQLEGVTGNLASPAGVVACPRNVREGLNALIDRRRGHSWAVTVDEDYDAAAVTVYSAFDEPVTVGDVSLEGARTTAKIDPHKPSALTLTRDTEAEYTRVIVRGNPILLTGSFDVAGGSLVPAWSPATETAYEALDDHDTAGDERYSHVYTTFVVPADKVPGGPQVHESGNLNTLVDSAVLPLGKQFIAQLPWADTADDSGASGDFRKILVAAQMEVGEETQSVLLDRLAELDEGAPSMAAAPLDGALGIRVAAKPPYLLGLDHYSDGDTYARQAVIDYGSLIITAAWYSDSILQVTETFTNSLGSDGDRTLTIDVPGAQCWYRLGGTVVDVRGGVLTGGDAPAAVLRNDVEILRGVAALAVAWYARPRRAVRARYAELKYDMPPGVLLTAIAGVDVAAEAIDVHTLVSRVTWDFVRSMTIVESAFAELDFAIISSLPIGSSIPGDPPLSAARSAGAPRPAAASFGVPAVPDRDENYSFVYDLTNGYLWKPTEKAPLFAVKVWQDGGSTDGDATNECDRTYTVRTIEATAPDTGGRLLGTGLAPQKRRWVTNHYGAYNCPASTGTGVVGLGYYDAADTFRLFDANETPDTSACD